MFFDWKLAYSEGRKSSELILKKILVYPSDVDLKGAKK